MGNLIKPYEISVWKDVLIQDGNTRRFIENKLAVIGSNTMTGFNKIYNPVFNKKANGEKTLTFSLKYKYEDPYIGQKVENPFTKLLVNESKVKLHYDGKWYEFIVKEHNESSEEYEWTYTCNDAFVQELSKRGYNLTFDSELNNNQGTARELAQATIQNTDWRLGGVDPLRQLIAEPLYKGVVSNSFQALNVDANQSETITKDTQVYVFYSYIKNKDGKFVQFFKATNPPEQLDSKNVITATNYRIIEDSKVSDTEIKNGNNTILINLRDSSWQGIENEYQGNRVAYNQLTTYDSVMGRTVDIFQADDREIYRYIDYAYTTSNVITNFFTNGENFNSLEDGTLQGWNPYVDFTSSSQDEKVDKLELVLRPELAPGKPLADLTLISRIEGFLKVQFKGPKTINNHNVKNLVFNNGFRDSASRIESVSKGEKFVFRWRAAQAGQGGFPNLVGTNKIRAFVAKYTQDDPVSYGYYYKHVDDRDIIFEFTGTPIEYNNYIEGGSLVETSTGSKKYNYVIDNVIQEPSTKYIYKDGNKEYIWNGTNGNFEEKTSSNYLPYYYLVASANKSVSKEALSNSTDRYGIFIYSLSNTNYTYYIQDIQLTRYIEGADKKPLLIGNIPEATSNSTSYYYLKPSDNITEEEVTTYTDLSSLEDDIGLARGSVVPLYNKNSEKRLTISATQSNCFNILQTIAETFECWVDLVVEHDEIGRIVYENGKPNKYVYLHEYAGSSNHAGFKYGINLKSIERNVNSEEFVTKLIVEQAQSEYVDEGYISIASAPANPSGESYILNFDYYYNQGLLDRDIVEADKINYVQQLVTKNSLIKEKEKERREKEASLTVLGSNRNVFTEMVDTAKENKSRALADFEELTNRTYDEYQRQQKDAIKYENRDYILTTDETVKDKSYYIWDEDNMIMTLVEEPRVTIDNPHTNGWYETLIDLSEEDTIYDIIGELYTDSAVINNYSGILTNIEQEYWKVRKELNGSENYNFKIWVEKDVNEVRHLRLELNDYLPGFSFRINNSGSTYSSSVSIKNFDIEINNSNVITINPFTAPSGYSIKNADSQTVTSYVVNENKIARFRIVCATTIPSMQDEIDKLIEEKQEIINDFENRYFRFIQEGTWSSTDYIDPELYYLDAINVSSTSAFPTISYTINVVEISELEGFEWYLFDAGQKTYIEDTEFFGWTIVDNIKTPAREDVFISEVEWHLESPEDNVITVQNYKTRFEDFFQRIDATVQTVQYNEVAYAKINTLLDSANASINKDVMLKSLNSIGGMSYTLTSNGSITIVEDAILVRNLQNPANLVKINSEGIRISSDGGATWATAISGQGINIGAVFTGTLNTNEIIIGNKDNPSFRWDKAGISAFKFDSSDEETPYDLQTFVRYDQYGLYGIKDNGSFKAEDLDDIKENAHFAVTWDGFFIKNSYPGGGRVEITSDNDFRVLKTNQNGLEREVIKIGALEWNGSPVRPSGSTIEPSLYGIRITNDDGVETFKTGDDGNIEITGTINATGGNFSNIVNVGPENQDHIIIDGTNASIRTSNYQDGAGYGWMINKDGDAVFNNITARGAIKTAVFEYAEIQAVGGIFLFRPSSTIKSARINGNDLIVKVEKPLLFAKIVYTLTEDTTIQEDKTYYEKTNYGYEAVVNPSSNPHAAGYYENNPELNNSWCKISNYTSDGSIPGADVRNILVTNGLTHVYRISNVNIATSEVTLENGKAFVDAVKQENESVQNVLDQLIGGALVDMGRKDGSTNYGIGVNSSDNTVNLPARAISLFETKIDETKELKVSYNYRGILGTLPNLQYTGTNPQVNSYYHNYLEGTQGIYTDNMYIGDHDQYLTFYTDRQGDKHLRISAREMIFGYDEDTGEEITWEQKIDDATQGEDAVQLVISSTIGNQIVNGIGEGAVYARLFKGDGEIDSLKTTVFSKTPPSTGTYYYHLDSTNHTCTLKKKINGEWVNAPTEDQPIYTYTWTFRDESGMPINYGSAASVVGKAIYIDGEIVDRKIVIECNVSDGN